MKVLVACEESQRVCIAFRQKGHEAFSCDLQECSGEHPEWHLQDDAIKVAYDKSYGWDAMIAFPPCTDLAKAGGTWFEKKRLNGKQEAAIMFFYKLHAAPIEKIALENPLGILSSDYIYKYFPWLISELKKQNLPRKPEQVIQPYYFGDPFRKYTCLWLKNFKPLHYSHSHTLFDQQTVVEPDGPTSFSIRKTEYRKGQIRRYYWQDKVSAKVKSKTFPGIAKAMADQWG
jgi:hypothetical protein